MTKGCLTFPRAFSCSPSRVLADRAQVVKTKVAQEEEHPSSTQHPQEVNRRLSWPGGDGQGSSVFGGT